MQVHQLTQNIEKLKSHMQRPKKINVDAKIIEKLATQSSTKYVVRGEKKPSNFHCSIYIFSIFLNLSNIIDKI